MQSSARLPALPRRLCPSPTTAGILLGSDPRHVAVARRWAARSSRARPGLADRISLAASELVTNAQRHSASGGTGGTVRVELLRTRLHLELRVTDNGPRPGHDIDFPRVTDPADPLRIGGHGLRLVESLSMYWDWLGHAGGPLTVRAMFPPS
ncbi:MULTISPECIES: ATP-binding protein [Nocardiopsis]|uniref:Anti-sigma regulatory factor (Ser/Thr protein kinase) n=1 Tax=Nocardiopsis sinuspersici TaxID=501010 RepID=A0A1V3C0Z0_9ACTN|nr:MULTISPECIES: ATP-binding protein [Nocardiopsis]NYH55529.1 anti-sigma regulatory factor (Ser/Thr protein kinase) [Nocardiopsis sinuspersici]OOC54149.1 histidine kinase [Nocardiopsis sinuspersici]